MDKSSLAEKIMRPVQLKNNTAASSSVANNQQHRKNSASTAALLAQPDTVTPSKQPMNWKATPDRKQQYSAMRSSTTPTPNAGLTTPLTKNTV